MPIGGLFATLRRLVRDLARELGKQADFVAEGGETELDKNVIDRLKDPLVHILRNCVDHGLEAPEVRLAAGKPARGTVHFRAAHVSGEVHIEICDDGQGVDLERVRAKALGKGLLTPGEPADERRILDCLFAPGFSTAQKISNISGRGVGLDVVKVSIEELRGQVKLESTPGAGTRVAMRPLHNSLRPFSAPRLQGQPPKIPRDAKGRAPFGIPRRLFRLLGLWSPRLFARNQACCRYFGGMGDTLFPKIFKKSLISTNYRYGLPCMMYGLQAFVPCKTKDVPKMDRCWDVEHPTMSGENVVPVGYEGMLGQQGEQALFWR